MIAQTLTSSVWFWIIAFAAAVAAIHFREKIKGILFRKTNFHPSAGPEEEKDGDDTITHPTHRGLFE